METAHRYWVHDLSPFLIQFGDSFGIRYYGLAYVLAFVAGALLLHLYQRRGISPLPKQLHWDLLFWLIIGVMAGGRIGYFLFYSPGTLVTQPWLLFAVWEGGMASHGGFLGVFIVLWWFCHKHRLSLLRVGDILVTLAPPGLLLGRIANFINGELYGKITNVAWGVIFPASAPPGTPVSLIEPRHPSQLYQALLEGLLPLLYTQWRLWRTSAQSRPEGRLAGEFLCLYAVGRMVGELFREPDAPLILWLSRGSFLSIFIFLAGIVLITRSRSSSA